MEDFTVGGQFVMSAGLGAIWFKLRGIERQLKSCPVCVKKSKMIAESVLFALAILATTFLTGCVKFSLSKPDGTAVNYSRFSIGAVKVDGLSASVTTNGTHYELKGYQTEQASTIEAIASGVARGLAKPRGRRKRYMVKRRGFVAGGGGFGGSGAGGIWGTLPKGIRGAVFELRDSGYFVDLECIDCDACAVPSRGRCKRDAYGGVYYVAEQPRFGSDEETSMNVSDLAEMEAAKAVCPVGAIKFFHNMLSQKLDEIEAVWAEREAEIPEHERSVLVPMPANLQRLFTPAPRAPRPVRSMF